MGHASGVTNAAICTAADRLATAATTGVPCPPVRDLIGSNDIGAAYAVQRELTAIRLAGGSSVTGRKIGLTSEAVQEQLGVDQPDFGVLFSDMEFRGGDTVPADAVLQPRVEAEIAFVLRSDLAEGDLDVAQVRGAIDYAVAALEICGSRVAGWDISLGDTVADNASAGAYVLGSQRRSLDIFEPRDTTMTMTIDGEVVAQGNGEACLGDPINAVVWLAREARRWGEPLHAGQVILSGAMGPMRPVSPGSTVRANVEGLGSVSFTLDQANGAVIEERS